VYVRVFRRHQRFSCVEHSLAVTFAGGAAAAAIGRAGAAVEAAAGASASPAVSPSRAPSSSFSSISMSGRVLPLPLSNISNSRSSDFSWDFHGQVQIRHYFLADMGGVTGEIVVVVGVHGIHLVVTTSKNGTTRIIKMRLIEP